MNYEDAHSEQEIECICDVTKSILPPGKLNARVSQYSKLQKRNSKTQYNTRKQTIRARSSRINMKQTDLVYNKLVNTSANTKTYRHYKKEDAVDVIQSIEKQM